MPNPRLKLWPPDKKWLRWGGTLVASVLFIRLLVKLNWVGVWENFKTLPTVILLIAFSLYLCGMLANALRWYILLKAAKIAVSFWETVKIVLLGAFISNYLPSTIGGDAVRFFSLLRFTSERAVGLASIILDRAVNVIAMLTILPFSVLTFYPLINTPESGSLAETLWMAAPGISTKTAEKIRRLPSQFSSWFAKGLATFRIWLQSPRDLALAFVVSWFSSFVIFVAIWLIAQGLGIDVALYQVMGTTVITYFLTLLPISVNGYGVREIAVTTLYMKLGATLEQASTLALITRAIMLIETLPGALWIPENVSESFDQGSISESDLSVEAEK